MSSYTTIGASRNIFQKFSNYRLNKESQSNNKTNKSGDSILNDSGNLK